MLLSTTFSWVYFTDVCRKTVCLCFAFIYLYASCMADELTLTVVSTSPVKNLEAKTFQQQRFKFTLYGFELRQRKSWVWMVRCMCMDGEIWVSTVSRWNSFFFCIFSLVQIVAELEMQFLNEKYLDPSLKSFISNVFHCKWSNFTSIYEDR